MLAKNKKYDKATFHILHLVLNYTCTPRFAFSFDFKMDSFRFDLA